MVGASSKSKKTFICKLQDLDNEAAVENLFVTPLFKILGYNDSQIKFKNDISPKKIALGSKFLNYKPDYLLLYDGKPRVVVDAKAPDEDLLTWIPQVSSYAISLNQTFKGENPVRYMVLSNGKRTLLYDWTEGVPLLDIDFDQMEPSHPKFKRLNTLLQPKATAQVNVSTVTMHRFERKSIEDVNASFARCHQLIYTSDALSQAAGFTEFVKLVFLKLLSDRKVRDAYGDLVWQERFDVPAAEVTFSSSWIKDMEPNTANPIDTLQFQKLIHVIEMGISTGTRKRIFSKDDHIRLHPETIKSVVKRLEHLFLFGIDVDLNGRLFETFLSATMRGKDLGQFFTPRSIVKLGTKFGNPYASKDHVDIVLDGCCGTGGFLIDSLADMWSKIDNNPTLSASDRISLRKKIANECLYGIDVGRDPNQARLARMNMYLHGDGGSLIFEADFLDKKLLDGTGDIETATYTKQLRETLGSASEGFCDLALTNPPFAKKYETSNEIQKAILSEYAIAEGESSVKSSLLFFERYHDVLREGGRLISVIDDGLLSGRDYKLFRNFLRERFLIRGVVSLPGDAFQRSQARVKTSIIILDKRSSTAQEAQGPVFMYACRYVGIDDPKRQRVLPVDRTNRAEANKEIQEASALFAAFLKGDQLATNYVVQPERILNRLDVKSCFAKTGRLIETWKNSGIQTVSLQDLLDEYEFSEDDTVLTENSAEEITYLVVGYDGVARAGETLLASDYKSGKRLYRVHANQIIVSHINAVHGSIGVVSDDLDGCVVTTEYTALTSKGKFDPKIICAIMRSPEIRAEFLVKASGVGRTRVEWSAIKDVVVPIPDAEFAKDVVHKMKNADKMLREAAEMRENVRVQIENAFSLATDAARATLQQFKPPK